MSRSTSVVFAVVMSLSSACANAYEHQLGASLGFGDTRGDNSDVGFHVQLNYSYYFHPSLAVEATWFAQQNITSGFTSYIGSLGEYTESTEYDGFALSIKGETALSERFNAFAKVGGAYTDYGVSIDYKDRDKQDEDKTYTGVRPYGGLGLNWKRKEGGFGVTILEYQYIGLPKGSHSNVFLTGITYSF
ncbi:outer membrane beta-barrel protein [Hahella sp. KA22]|uniref:outer membrane beta-barrel protein n=1 Tax=unclassified Hahella TaxID=2624107 RepID=UPI0013E28FF7|nr:outer membrane beta-barrel protein [Hahella sp. KA22]